MGSIMSSSHKLRQELMAANARASMQVALKTTTFADIVYEQCVKIVPSSVRESEGLLSQYMLKKSEDLQEEKRRWYHGRHESWDRPGMSAPRISSPCLDRMADARMEHEKTLAARQIGEHSPLFDPCMPRASLEPYIDHRTAVTYGKLAGKLAE